MLRSAFATEVDIVDKLDQRRARGLALLRIAVGAGFLYAGLEKVFDFAGAGAPWTAAGFLKFGTGGTIPNMTGLPDPMSHNPIQGFWGGLAADPGLLGLINFLVVFGEVAIGIALVLGLATRLAGALGAIMMFLFWLAAWDFEYGPVNQQFVYMILSAIVAYASAGKTLGLDEKLEESGLAHRFAPLRLAMG